MNAYTDQDDEWIAATRTVVPPVYTDYLTVNYTTGRHGSVVMAIILHITAGESASSAIDWFKNPGSGVIQPLRHRPRRHHLRHRARAGHGLGQRHCRARQHRDPDIVANWVANDINPNWRRIGIEVAGYSSMQPSGQPPHLVGYTEATVRRARLPAARADRPVGCPDLRPELRVRSLRDQRHPARELPRTVGRASGHASLA